MAHQQQSGTGGSGGREPAQVVVDGQATGLAELEAVARQGAHIRLGEAGRERLTRAQAALQHAIAEKQVLYGVNTGFGSLARQRVSGDQLREIQQNLILSHAAGVGQPLPDAVVRGMWFLLVASLARGHFGVRPVVVEHLIALLNAGVTPLVP